MSKILVKKTNLNLDNFVSSFSVCQIIGSIYLITRFSNTGFYYGSGNDDFIYLNSLLYLYNTNLIVDVVNIFSYLIFPFFFIQSIFLELKIIDVILINWILFSLMFSLMLKSLETFQPINRYIILLSFLSFPFVLDNVVHFYRDMTILFSLVLYFILSKTILTRIYYYLPAFLLRTTSLFIIILNKMGNKLKNSKRPILNLIFSIILITTFLTQFWNVINSSSNFLFGYATDVSRLTRRSSAFENFTAEEFVDFRLKNRYEKNSELYENNLKSAALRFVTYYFNPLTFKPLDHPILTKEKAIIHGINYYSFFVVNFFIAFKIIAVPLFLIGIAFNFKDKIDYFFVFLLYSLAVIFVSFQSRHLLSIGYVLIYYLSSSLDILKQNHSIKILFLFLSLIIVFILFFFNL